jgi:CRISPR-associated protein Cas2
VVRRNRYSGVLKPLALGHGAPEVHLVLIYDIEDDRVRTRISEICLDYGLERIQFSAFAGKLSRSRRQELALRLVREVEGASARIHIYPICEDDLKDMWKLEQYRPWPEPLKVDAGKCVRRGLKIVGDEH